jgi:tripartite-type tricarboxylate transporter receptor subunit TctC
MNRTEMRAMPRWMLSIAAAMAACGVLAMHAAFAAEGDDYPRRPVKLILPNAAGSSSDTIGRIMAQALGEELGQPVVVENIAGAGGTIAMDSAKNAAPDGYTLVVATPSGTSIAKSLRKKLRYDPIADFEYISTYAVVPNLLVVNPQLPVKTLKDLMEYARSKQGDTFMASAGPGSQSHLAGAMLLQMGGFPSVHVPYKGGGGQVLAVMSGEAQWTITPASSVVGHTRTGKLRAVAQSLPQRTPLLPDVPAVAETIPGFSYSGWNGLLAPKGTPSAIVNRIRAALDKALAKPQLKEAFERQAAEPTTDTPEEFRKMVEAETRATADLVKASHISIEK